jgi:hypothetical protein
MQRAQGFDLGAGRIFLAVGDVRQIIGQPDDDAPVCRADGLPKLHYGLIYSLVEVRRLVRRHGSGLFDGLHRSPTIHREPIYQAGVAGIDHYRDFIGGLESGRRRPGLSVQHLYIQQHQLGCPRKTGVWSWANGAIAASRRAGTVNLITDCYAPRSGCDAAGEQESLTDESGHR